MSELAEAFTAVHAMPLPDQMRLAADILVTTSMRYFESRESKPELVDWRPANLRSVAREFEEQDAAQERQREQIEELAKVIYQDWPLIDSLGNPTNRLDTSMIFAHVKCRAIATKLIEDGWSKP